MGKQRHLKNRTAGGAPTRRDHRGRFQSDQLDLPTVVGVEAELDLSKREFAILASVLAIAKATDLVVASAVGQKWVTPKELDDLWSKVLDVCMSLEVTDEDVLAEQMWFGAGGAE